MKFPDLRLPVKERRAGDWKPHDPRAASHRGPSSPRSTVRAGVRRAAAPESVPGGPEVA